jgi:hypothetical protein
MSESSQPQTLRAVCRPAPYLAPVPSYRVDLPLRQGIETLQIGREPLAMFRSFPRS